MVDHGALENGALQGCALENGALEDRVLELLDEKILSNPVRDWAVALGILIGTVVVLRIFKGVVLTRLERWAERTPTRLDDMVLRALQHTRWFFYGGVGIWLGSKHLRIPKEGREAITLGLVTVILIQLGIWAQHAVHGALDAWALRSGRGVDPGRQTMAAAVGFLSRLAIWSIILILVLSNAGVEISALVAGVGVGGIAAALALQNVLGDLFASLSIYFDRPFDLGDFVIIDDFMGNVDRIGLRSTRIRSVNGEHIVFPNGDVLKSRIRNYYRMEERRTLFRFGVKYDTPHDTLARIPELVRDACDDVELARFDRANLNAFGQHALEFEVAYWVQNRDYAVYMATHQQVLLGIHRRFEAEGIHFAYPTRTLHLSVETPVDVGEADPDRPRPARRAPAP